MFQQQSLFSARGRSYQENRETVGAHDAGLRLSVGELQVENGDGEASPWPLQEEAEGPLRQGEGR